MLLKAESTGEFAENSSDGNPQILDTVVNLYCGIEVELLFYYHMQLVLIFVLQRQWQNGSRMSNFGILWGRRIYEPAGF